MTTMNEFLDKGFDHFTIVTNNYCNLYCEHCVYLSHIQINQENENIFRRQKWELSLDDLELFCERFEGIGEESLHFLSGGEPTCLPMDKLVQVVDMLSSYNRRVALFTNGYNVMGIPRNTVNKIHHMRLDDHGTNSKHIQECVDYLKPFYNGKVETIHQKFHWDVEPAKKRKSSGKRCGAWMSILPLLGETLFPCCNTPCLMLQSNDTKMGDELNNSGWTIRNEDVVETVRDWRNTIPSYVSEHCLNNCYQPKINVGQGKTRITLKPHSVIKKGNQ